MRKRLLTATLLIGHLVHAQSWDVNNPPGIYDEVRFNTTEGTWMNLDISPDGKTLVFDLLGDIYTMPSTGGTASCLRSGLAFEVQPRFSPDGSKILFTSDAGGGDNTWMMNADGSNAQEITKEDFRLLNNASWAPGGEYFVARKHFTSSRSLGAGEIWMYHHSGGKGIQLTKRKNDQQDVNEPVFSHDGRYVYFSEDQYPGGYFQYNKDPNTTIYSIRRYDMNNGELKTVIARPGGAVRPQPSPDGKYLAYVRRVRTKTVLYLHELETGKEFPVYQELSKDQQEAWAIFGVYPGYAWSKDGKYIYFWAKGKINKLDIESKKVVEIPFNVEVVQKIRRAIKHEQNPAPDQFEAKMIRHAETSPDGKILLFSAVGYIWKKELPNGVPTRLSQQTESFEFEPRFSPDGKQVAFVTWNDEKTGALQLLNLKSNKSIALVQGRGIYRSPSFSADGKKIIFAKEAGNDHQGFHFMHEAGIWQIDLNGTGLEKLLDKAEQPFYSQNGDRVFYQRGNEFFAYHLKTKKEVKMITSAYATRYTPSPDHKWIAFTYLHKVYVAAWPETGTVLDLSAESKNVPVMQFADHAGINLHWSSNSKVLSYTLGNQLFQCELSRYFKFLPGYTDSLSKFNQIDIGLNLQTQKPKTAYVLNNARIITVNQNQEVIENGFVLVHDNKIAAIGQGDYLKANIPNDRKVEVMDCSGKTIMPGLVDVHAHLWTFRQGLHPQKFWPYYANLAYGVTTTHDPSSNTEMVFTQSEMVKYGSMVGPRVFSTGTILYGADGDFKAVINNLDDAASAVYRTKAFGAFSVKSYNQPRRNQRQQVIHAADSLGIMVYPEGGSFFYHNLSMILDGHTGVEHNIPVAPVYNDVIKLWAASKTGYTPTLVVSYGSVSGEYYWYQKTNVWENDKLLRFTPRSVIDTRARHRIMIPDEEYENGHILISKSCKKLADAGVLVNLGSHGQIQGIGAHWEMWMLEQGGMTPMQAIKAATYNGAHYIGMNQHLGSIEKGKLADLIILNSNPLDNIRNSTNIYQVMMNGVLYDAETMKPHRESKAPQFWFNQFDFDESFPWNEYSGENAIPKCHCGKH